MIIRPAIKQYLKFLKIKGDLRVHPRIYEYVNKIIDSSQA